MFHHRHGYVVPQWEHSRLSGSLAVLLGQATGVQFAELFAAIAMHDWPHFRHDPLADQIVVGEKTEQQQRELSQRLRSELPLAPLVQLVVLLHWRRLSDDVDITDAIDEARIAALLDTLGMDREEADRADHWTHLCDALAYYLSRGEEAQAEMQLPDPFDSARQWRLSWEVTADRLVVRGCGSELRSQLCLLMYKASGYPNQLSPKFQNINIEFS
jgi:hypothetical protein